MKYQMETNNLGPQHSVCIRANSPQVGLGKIPFDSPLLLNELVHQLGPHPPTQLK